MLNKNLDPNNRSDGGDVTKSDLVATPETDHTVQEVLNQTGPFSSDGAYKD